MSCRTWTSKRLVIATLLACSTSVVAQNIQLAETSPAAMRSVLPDAPKPSSAAPQSDLPLERQPHASVTVADSPKHGITDLGHIAVFPKYIRTRDLEWLVPLTAATGVAFATDTHTMTEVVSQNPSFNNAAINASNALVGGMIALPVAAFGIGQMKHSEHLRETGILGGEAMVDAFVVDQALKLCTFRERPNVDKAQGEFFIGKSGADSAFASTHSVLAWSSAAVITGEYHSRWKQVAVYTAAAGVSATRVMGQQHFPSDVLVGSAAGWLIGHYVYRAHHHADVATE